MYKCIQHKGLTCCSHRAKILYVFARFALGIEETCTVQQKMQKTTYLRIEPLIVGVQLTKKGHVSTCQVHVIKISLKRIAYII